MVGKRDGGGADGSDLLGVESGPIVFFLGDAAGAHIVVDFYDAWDEVAYDLCHQNFIKLRSLKVKYHHPRNL